MAGTPATRTGELSATAIAGQKKLAADSIAPSSATERNAAIFLWKAGVKTQDKLIERTRSCVAEASGHHRRLPADMPLDVVYVVYGARAKRRDTLS